MKFALVLAILAVAPPAAAQQVEALYESTAADWAKYIGMKSACSGAENRSAVEAEAAVGAELVAPGSWAWLTGTQADTERRFSNSWLAAYSQGEREPNCLGVDFIVKGYRDMLDQAHDMIKRRQ